MDQHLLDGRPAQPADPDRQRPADETGVDGGVADVGPDRRRDASAGALELDLEWLQDLLDEGAGARLER